MQVLKLNKIIRSVTFCGLLLTTTGMVHADTTQVTVDGTTYEIGRQKFGTYSDDVLLQQSYSWYGNQSLAESISGLVQGQQSLFSSPTDTVTGAMFLFEVNSSIDNRFVYWYSSSVNTNYATQAFPFFYSPPFSSFPALYFATEESVVASTGITSETNASSPSSTTFAGGTLKIDVSDTFTTDYSVGSAGGTINLNGHSTTMSGVFSGAGDLTFSNTTTTGSLTLSGTSTKTGNLITGNKVNLSVTGDVSSASSLTSQSGSVIRGTGVLPSSTFQSGSIHAPGLSIGKQSISGNYNLNTGSQLQIEIQGPQIDKLSVTGTTTLDGEIVILPYDSGSPFPNLNYQLIDSGSTVTYNGTLNQEAITSKLLSEGADLVVGNDGDPTTFDIEWQPKNGSGVVGSALKGLGINNANQRATANVLDTSFKKLASVSGNDASTSGKNSTGSSIGNTGFTTGQAEAAGYKTEFVELLDDLVQLSSSSELSSAINSLSPEPYAAFQAVGLNSLKQQRQLIATHAGKCDSTGWVPTVTETDVENNSTIKKNLPFCIFGDGGALNTSINGTNGLSSYHSNSNIAFWGIEYSPSKEWSIGTAYGYGNANLYGLKSTYANVSSTNNSGVIYGVYRPIEQLELLANFGYTKFNINGSRNVSFIGNGKANTAKTSADGFTTSLDAKYSITVNTGSDKDWLVVSPMLGIAWGNYQQSGFTESGGGATELQVNPHTANSLIGTIGFELSTTPISLGEKESSSSFTPKLAFTYNVDALANSSSTKEIKSSFVAAPGAGTMLTEGQNGGANSFTIAAGGDLKMSEGTALYASVDYQIEDNGSQLGYSGGLRFLF